MVNYDYMKKCTDDFMSLWRCTRPTIAKVHSHAVTGGSDIALCCELLTMADEARNGYMPTRVWGRCKTSSTPRPGSLPSASPACRAVIWRCTNSSLTR